MFNENQGYVKRYTLLGAKAFSGDVDGKRYDSSTFFVAIKVTAPDGLCKGFCTQTLRGQSSEQFQRIKHLSFPLECEFVVEEESSGKADAQVRLIVKDVKPVQPERGAPVQGGAAKGP